MALSSPAEDSPSKILVATSGDRQKAFRRARRHSLLVRALRLTLPVIALGLIASYGLFVQRTIKIESDQIAGVINTGPIVASFDNLAMSNPRFNGFNRKDGSTYTVTAKKAVTDLSPIKPVGLVGITGVVRQPDGNEITIEATDGKFLRKSSRLELFNGIRLKTTSGLHGRLVSALVLPKEGTVTSEQPVDLWMKAGRVRANAMVLRHKVHEVVFSNGVAVRLSPAKNPATGKVKPTASVPTIDLAGASGAPVDVRSATMTVKDHQHSILLSGNVHATQGPATLTSRELEILYKPRAPAAGATQPKAEASAAAALGGATEIRSARASGDVTITRETSRAIATVAHFLTQEKRVVLVGDVVVTSGSDRRILADRAEIETETNDAVLTGRNVTLTQGKNVLRGSHAVVKRASGRMRLTRPGGRIAAVLAPRPRKQKRPAARTARNPASSKSTLSGLAGGWSFTSNPNAPIEIGAVSLDVDDKAKAAVFQGKVVARQGGVVIQTPNLTAIYQGGSSLLPVAATAPKTAQNRKPAAEAHVTHIKAANGVLITSENGQLVQGDWADFDVAANTATIGGHVRLQKGRQVVTGPKVVIDLTTGLSRVIRSGGTVAVTPRQPSVAGTAGVLDRCRQGRSCLVFFPGDAKAARKLKKKLRTKQKSVSGKLVPAPAPATVGSSWSTVPTPSN
jgi:hypothetical protein